MLPRVSPFGEALIGLMILVGLVGIVLPVLPGLLLILAAVLVWSLVEGGAAWWMAFGAVVIAGAGTIVKYAIPGRRLSESGLPTRTLVIAIGAAFVGFFLLPIVGAPIGFVLTIWLFERTRLGREDAWPAATRALAAVVQSIGIELAAGLLIAGAWLGVVVFG